MTPHSPSSDMHYVYVLKCADNQLYIGYTHDLRERLNQHLQGWSQATKSRLPVVLVYYESYRDREDAQQREKSLKQFGQSYRHLKERIRGSILSRWEVSAG